MKKLLGILAALGLSATTASTVVACSKPMTTNAIPNDTGVRKELAIKTLSQITTPNSDEQLMGIYFNDDLAGMEVDLNTIYLEAKDSTNHEDIYHFVESDSINYDEISSKAIRLSDDKPIKSTAEAGHAIYLRLDNCAKELVDKSEYEVDLTKLVVTNDKGEKLQLHTYIPNGGQDTYAMKYKKPANLSQN